MTQPMTTTLARARMQPGNNSLPIEYQGDNLRKTLAIDRRYDFQWLQGSLREIRDDQVAELLLQRLQDTANERDIGNLGQSLHSLITRYHQLKVALQSAFEKSPPSTIDLLRTAL